jgi:hypothetical protein
MTTDTEYKWWEDWELMDRLLSYDPETGIIYAKERSECDFEDRGSGSSFISAKGLASKYNKDTCGRHMFNRRRKPPRATYYYLVGSMSYKGHSKQLQAHRVAFFLYHKRYPVFPLTIDHINRNGCDNRIVNLREATPKEQSTNTSISKANTSGVKGVSFLTARNKWRASININGKKTNLGTFVTLHEATLARKKAENDLSI